MTKLIAFAASTRTDSLNKKLIRIATRRAEAAGASVELFDYAAFESPLYHDEAVAPFPAGARTLADALRRADGCIIASPEYNWSIPGGLKNLIDWLSTDKPSPLKGKTALLMCASPSVRGGILGLNQLSVPLNHLGVYVYPHLVAIGEADDQITETGIGNSKDDKFLAECVTDFVRMTKELSR